MAAQADDKVKGNKPKVIFQLGTNNWQWADEAAPGSGILHESHHNAYNSMQDVISYSIYPSQKHSTKDIKNNEDDLIRIYKLDANIPVCESSSPVSKRRWHAMPQEEVDKYRTDLENMVYDYLLDIEKKYGQNCIYFCVAHHTFMNCVVLRNVMIRREKENLPIPTCMVFCHGTGLKMYQNELREEEQFKDKTEEKDAADKPREFPLKFYPMMNELGIFSNPEKKGYINYLLANSTKVIKEFKKLFKDFEAEESQTQRCILNYPGINQNVFKVEPEIKELILKDGSKKALNEVLKGLKLKPKDLGDAENVVEVDNVIGSGVEYDALVIFVGKLADWKRMDYVMDASKIYEKKFEDKNKKVLTLLIGGGVEKNQVFYLKQLKDLENENKNIFYVGPQMQPILCKLWNVAAVGVYPSKNEPFGMVFIETMACGTPVIGAKSGGPIDFIDEKVGVLIEENEDKQIMVQDLAKNITEFVLNDEKSKKKEECIKRADSFGVTGMQKKLLRELEPLLNAEKK